MAEQKPAPVGYDDTPMIPGTNWHVHDGNRPQPRVVTPPTASTQEAPGNPPSDATVLFDGTDASKWKKLNGGDVEWKIENGYWEVNHTGNIVTKDKFGACHLHVEWAAPAEVVGNSQGRGNSGVFLLGMYEIQVLDGYNNRTYADGITAAVYGQYPPLVNACRKPGEWQTYDIFFYPPHFEGDKLARPAYVTVIHNGIPVHIHQELMGPTGHKKTASYEPHDEVGPVMLQDHNNPVRFRNIWIRKLTGYDEA